MLRCPFSARTGTGAGLHALPVSAPLRISPVRLRGGGPLHSYCRHAERVRAGLIRNLLLCEMAADYVKSYDSGRFS